MKHNFTTKRRERVFYGMGNLGYGVVAQTAAYVIMFFGTAVWGISGTLMGLAIAASVFWDAITDPIIGYLSDRQKSKFFGKRHGFMLIGIIGMAIFNIVLWSVPSFLDQGAKFVWILVSLLALETFNTMFATPYTALGTELSSDYNEKTNIQAYKTVFFLISFMFPTIFIYLFLADKTQPGGYISMGLVTSVICVVFGLLSVFGTYSTLPKLRKKAALSKEAKKAKKPRQIFKLFFKTLKKPNYRNLVWGYSVGLVSSAFIASLGLHLFTFTFEFSTTYTTLCMASVIVGTILSQPIWLILSRKFEKKTALKQGILTSLIGVSLVALVIIFRNQMSQTITLIALMATLFISGFGTGSLYSLPISMFSDLMAIEYAKTNEEQTGTFSGFMTLSYKTANAFALFVIGILLDIIKFDSELPTQSVGVQNGLGIIAISGIVISLVGSLAIYKGYSITRKQVEDANKEIRKMHKGQDFENAPNEKVKLAKEEE